MKDFTVLDLPFCFQLYVTHKDFRSLELLTFRCLLYVFTMNAVGFLSGIAETLRIYAEA